LVVPEKIDLLAGQLVGRRKPLLVAGCTVQREQSVGKKRVILENATERRLAAGIGPEQPPYVPAQTHEDAGVRPLRRRHVLWLLQDSTGVGIAANHQAIGGRQDLVVGAGALTLCPKRQQFGANRRQTLLQRFLAQSALFCQLLKRSTSLKAEILLL